MVHLPALKGERGSSWATAKVGAFAIIDAWPGHDEGHAAIARHLADEHGVCDWWAQGVTVGYERMTGRRATNQHSDGTITANVSRTVHAAAALVREALLDESAHRDLFGGLDSELCSRPSARSLRVAIGPGIALFTIATRDDGRITVTIAHEKLPEADDVDHWKAYWREWLQALDGAA